MQFASDDNMPFRHQSDTYSVAAVDRHLLANLHIAIAASRFNADITSSLYENTYARLTDLGIKSENITTAWCPGAFEIPLVVKHLARLDKYNAIIALGAVIRGETWHFELVANNCALGILNTSLEFETPIIFGILATDDHEQAVMRSSPDHFNAGAVAAETAVEMSVKIMDIKSRLQPDAPSGHKAG